jgi:hypothetical protein
LAKTTDELNEETAKSIILDALSNVNGKTKLGLIISTIAAKLGEAKANGTLNAMLVGQIILETILGALDVKRLITTIALTAALLVLVGVGVLIYKSLKS